MSQNNVGGSVDADSGEETNSNDSSEDCVELKSPFENEAQDVILLRKITIFLTEPNSSWWSFVYCTITSIVVLIHVRSLKIIKGIFDVIICILSFHVVHICRIIDTFCLFGICGWS